MPTAPEQACNSFSQVVEFFSSSIETQQKLSEEQKQQFEAKIQELQSLLFAFVEDSPMPLSLLKPWASKSQFFVWEKQGKIKLERANGKVCVRPKTFFNFWNQLAK